jgi:hypothetical protein
MALTETANGRIAGHGADGGETMRHQGGARAHARAGGRGFAAGVAAANHDYVVYFHAKASNARLVAEAWDRVKNQLFSAVVSRETCHKR